MRCVYHTCKRIARTRGVCSSCYSRLYKMVERKHTTWAELERQGFATEAKPKNNGAARQNRIRERMKKS